MLMCLVLVALTYCTQSGETAISNDTAVQLPSSEKQNKTVKPSVIMNGYNNYQATRQIFHIYKEDQRMPNCCTNVPIIRDDYVYTPGIGAHKLHTEGDDWNTARKTCIQEGAHLAIINSDAEQKVLLEEVVKKVFIGAWVGFHDFYKEGDWTTVLDQTLESTGYSTWSPKWINETHGPNDNVKCGLLAFEGGLTRGPCSLGLPFICKINTAACTEKIPEAH